MNDVTQEMEYAKSVALEAGQILRIYYKKSLEYEKKSDGSLVCQADLATEKFIISKLKLQYPQYAIYSEESGREKTTNTAGTWHVDPLDGTHNFLRGIPHYGLCLALEKKGQLSCGIIYLPEQDELFYAAIGHGAFCNNKKINVSTRTYQNALLHYEGFIKTATQWSSFEKIYTNFELRIIYSTAYSLALLVSGKIEACYSETDHYFDFAAGAIILQEAGGVITNIDGGTLSPSKGFIASNGQFHDQLITYINSEDSYD